MKRFPEFPKIKLAAMPLNVQASMTSKKVFASERRTALHAVLRARASLCGMVRGVESTGVEVLAACPIGRVAASSLRRMMVERGLGWKAGALGSGRHIEQKEMCSTHLAPPAFLQSSMAFC